MLLFITKRLLWLIPILIGVSILIFVITSFTPGDPVRIMLGAMATEDQMDAAREELGLNDPLIIQYFNYMKSLILEGELGISYVTHESVMTEVLHRLPYTLIIALVSLVITIIAGIPLGVLAAVNQFTWKDSAAMFVSMVMVAIPDFWLALNFVLLFSLTLGWLPAVGVGSWLNYIMPCLAISMHGIATITRQTRSSVLEVIRQDYITTARAKGLSRRDVIYKHTLKNALIPIIMTIGGGIAMRLGGALIAETIFSIPGMGVYMMGAIRARDYPIIRGSALVISVWFCLVMLLVDIVFALVDPRIRVQFVKKGNK